MGFNCALPKGGDRDALRVIKITSRCDGQLSAAPGGGGGAGTGAGLDVAAPAPLERQLAETRRADVYSIYFTFNSDVIRPESEPTLEEIAAVLTKHGGWNLHIEGHTDGIGGDQQNLDLSRRRAAAVKNALTKRYQIPMGQLTTGGYGNSRPKDTNDTIEGRARNRRVELVRTS